MTTHTIYYTKTEITRACVEVEADSLAEAIELVETYEFDNSDEYEVDSLEYSVAEVSTQRNVLA